MNKETLIARYLDGSITDEEHKVFDNLMATDSEFAVEFANYQKIWEISSALNVDDSEFNVTASWNQWMDKDTKDVVKPMYTRPWFQSFARVAAVVVIALSSYFVFHKYTSDSFNLGLVHETKQDNQVVGLSDGSHVYLDDVSELVIDRSFNEESRTMRLNNGKGFFVVKPDKDKAFEVVTDHLTAIVKGTTFLVRTDDHSASVGVNTGVVEVHVGNQTVTLRAGDQIDFDASNGGVVTRSVFKKEAFETLQSESFKYHDTPLKVVLNDLLAVKGLKIIVSESLESQRFTLALNQSSSDDIVNTIAIAAGMQYKKEANAYILFSK